MYLCPPAAFSALARHECRVLQEQKKKLTVEGCLCVKTHTAQTVMFAAANNSLPLDCSADRPPLLLTHLVYVDHHYFFHRLMAQHLTRCCTLATC
jgi:hypothetical protein